MKDLSHLNVVTASEKGMSLELPGPDGKLTGVTLQFLGFDASSVVKAAREFDKAEADNPRKDEHPDDYQKRRRAHVVAAAVTDWGGLGLDGEAVTAANAARFLANRAYSWIADNVYARGSIRANFFPKDSES